MRMPTAPYVNSIAQQSRDDKLVFITNKALARKLRVTKFCRCQFLDVI